jgi:hemoglobin
MSQSLFDAMGGAESVHAIVKTMYEAVMTDAVLAPFFANSDIQRLHQMQFEFIASALGGPVRYSGNELHAIHAGRGIQPQHFSKFVGHLADAMEQHGATSEQVDSMLGSMAMFRDRIVGSANVDG